MHQAPAFGAEDMAVARAYGLPVLRPVQPDGHFAPDVALVGGEFFKHADKALVRDLESRGLLLRTWRTSTPTRTAGAATPRCSTTRCRPGTSGRPR